MGKQACCAGNGGKMRVWLFMRVDDPLRAAQKLHRLALDQQWDPEWSIKRVDTVDHEDTKNLPTFAAPQDCHNLLVAIEAADDRALRDAFYRIKEAIVDNLAPGRDPHGHALSSSTYLDWN